MLRSHAETLINAVTTYVFIVESVYLPAVRILFPIYFELRFIRDPRLATEGQTPEDSASTLSFATTFMTSCRWLCRYFTRTEAMRTCTLTRLDNSLDFR